MVKSRVSLREIRGTIAVYNIYLPPKLNDRTTSEFYCSTLIRLTNECPSKINFDFNQLEFIDPVGVVTLWNMVEYFEKKCNADIYYATPKAYVKNPRSYKAIDYLDDSLFFEKVMGEKLHPGSSERSTTNGLEKLRPGNFNYQYIERTISWLKGSVSLRGRSFSFLETTFGEIFNNINDHSESIIGGCSFSQHYPAHKEIILCIADAGKGIANKMKEKFSLDGQGRPLNTDGKLINYATEHKVSTKTTPGNRGLGLDNLLTIMESNKGSMKIISNKGVLDYNYTNKPDLHGSKKRIKSSSFYNGTVIILKFRTDTLDEEEEEDFEWY